jgi:hypothetical protein
MTAYSDLVIATLISAMYRNLDMEPSERKKKKDNNFSPNNIYF